MHYTLSIREPQQHLVHVRLDIAAIEEPVLRVQMAAWTPGSYLLREYARLVRNVRASSFGEPLACRKIDKLTWEIDAGAAAIVTVEYEVYGYDLTVRTNHIDATHAHITPAATLMFVPGREREPAEISLELPADWRVATGLERTADGTYTAPNLDTLFDSPLELGLHDRYEWEVDGRPHALVIWGRGNEDREQLVADARRIVETERDFWGGALPYDHYTFILLLGGPDAGGGLEHHNSTVLLLPRHIFRPAKNYERYLGLVSHEFFHTWNVKRLRAAPLGPFDYTAENYTRLLWVMEGFTEYYTDLMLVRGGLMTPERYLSRLADDIATLQTTPGRLLTSVADASLDAWIKLYRPDETTPNTTISYYLKGAMVALILDMELRQRSAGRVSLDDLIRRLYAAYPRSGPGIPEADGMRRALEELLPGDWDEFFARYVDGLDELPFDTALRTVGLTLEWSYKTSAPDSSEPAPQLGARLRTTDGRLRLTHVIDGGAAAAAGLAPGDELVAIDGWRITEETLPKRLEVYPLEATISVTLFRQDELLTLPVTLLRPPYDALKLTLAGRPSARQRAAYRHWLGQPAASGERGGSNASAVGTEEQSRPRRTRA